LPGFAGGAVEAVGRIGAETRLQYAFERGVKTGDEADAHSAEGVAVVGVLEGDETVSAGLAGIVPIL
jgi:hypothetical protein